MGVAQAPAVPPACPRIPATLLPQAWLFWNPGTRSLCIAFRGTEQAKWKASGWLQGGWVVEECAPTASLHKWGGAPCPLLKPWFNKLSNGLNCASLPCLQDILTDLLLVPASLDPEGLAERPWVPRSSQQVAGGPPNMEAAVVRCACYAVHAVHLLVLGMAVRPKTSRVGAGHGLLCPWLMCCWLSTPTYSFLYAHLLQAALQSKRLELRAAVADGLRSVFQQQQQRQQARQQQAGAAGGGAAGDGEEQPGEEAVWVHNGFLDAYASVRSEVMRLLETALAGGGRGGQGGAVSVP